MEFARNGRSVVLGIATAAATALLVWFGIGLHPVWPLMWVAPLPALVYALRSRTAWGAALVAWLGWFVGCGNLLGYMRLLGSPVMAWATAFGLTALVFAAGVLLCRALLQRGAVWSAVAALPALWATFEYVRNLLWPHGSAGSLAYSQLNFLPFLQLASLTGPWGMSFVLLLFSAGLAVAWHVGRTEAGRAWRIAGTTAAVVLAVLIFGAVRLSMRQPGPVVKVGLVASDAGRNWIPARPGAATEQLLTQYAEQAQGLFARGAQVVVIPENLGVLAKDDAAQVDAIFQPVLDRAGTMLIAGVNDSTGNVSYNEARVYAAGTPVRTYHKHHLLPPFENMFTPGHSSLTFAGVGAAASDRWGVEICKDMDFTEPARGYGRAGAGLMLVPAWDFTVDAFWHGHIAVMRTVEDGFSLARTAKHSTMVVVDDRGRVIAETPSNAAPFATLLADVPSGHDATLFQLWGDWFGWFAMALLVVVLMRRWTAGRSTTENIESTERESVASRL